MAVVHIDFIPPEYEGFVGLEIWETVDIPSAPGTLIETVVIDPDNYITRYTTILATNVNHYFSIRWVDAAGAKTDFSTPMRGGTTTLIGILIDRVLLRNASLDENIVVQAAEYVVAQVLHTEDVYSFERDDVTYAQLEGLTLLTMARCYVASIASGASSDTYVAGLVSQKSGTSDDLKDMIEWLLAEGNKALGINFSWVFLLEDIDPTGLGTISTINYDQSRLAVTLEIE